MNLRLLSPMEIVGLTIYGEARGEPIEGQIAVGCVIRNRLHMTANKTYHDIILAPLQFSCWNETDTNRPMLEEMADKIITGQVPIEVKECLWVAKGIIDWVLKDNTTSAMNYLETSLYIIKPPKWATKMKVTRQIGNHTFLTV